MIATTSDKNVGLFEFQSLNGDVVERWKDHGADKSRYQMERLYCEFRLADRDEIKEGADARATYYLRKLLRKLKIHPSSRSDDLL